MFAPAVKFAHPQVTGGTSTLGKWLVVVGLTFQLTGAWITVRGLRLAWSDKRGQERFLEPLTSRWSAFYASIVRFVRWVIRKPGPVTVQVGPATDTSWAGQVYPQMGYDPVSEDMDLPETLRELDVRFRQINIATNDLRRQVADERHRAEIAEQNLEIALAGRIEQAAEHERALTVHALRWEASGFALITLGAVIQAIGSLV